MSHICLVGFLFSDRKRRIIHYYLFEGLGVGIDKKDNFDMIFVQENKMSTAFIN